MSAPAGSAPRTWRFRYLDETYAFRYGDTVAPTLIRERRIGSAGEHHFGPTDTLRVGPGEFMWGADLLSAVISGRDLGRDAGLRAAVVAYLTAAAEAVVSLSKPLADGVAAPSVQVSGPANLGHAA